MATLLIFSWKASPVASINFLDEKVKVYNFEVEGNHNYYVSEKGILVHNNCEWTNAIINILENSASGMTKHLSEHFFAGEFNIGGRDLYHKCFKKDYLTKMY